MKSNLKRLDFPNQTPLRNNTHTSDFYSSQKAKYDIGPKYSHLSSSNIILNPEACKIFHA